MISLCHCLACQKRTGAPYSVAAIYAIDQTSTTGQSLKYSRSSDRGFDIDFHFCGNCGSTVYWYPQRMPDRVAVAVGMFADPDFPKPTHSVFEQTRHRWVTLPEGVSRPGKG